MEGASSESGWSTYLMKSYRTSEEERVDDPSMVSDASSSRRRLHQPRSGDNSDDNLSSLSSTDSSLQKKRKVAPKEEEEDEKDHDSLSLDEANISLKLSKRSFSICSRGDVQDRVAEVRSKNSKNPLSYATQFENITSRRRQRSKSRRSR